MRTVDEFTPVEDHPLMWTDEAGEFYLLAQGMTIEEFVDDLNNLPPPLDPSEYVQHPDPLEARLVALEARLAKLEAKL